MNGLSNQLNGLMQQSQSYAAGQLSAVPQPLPISQLWHAIGQLKDAANRAYTASEALCGLLSTGEGAIEGCPKNPAGVFANVESAASEISYLAAAIDTYMSRIMSNV